MTNSEPSAAGAISSSPVDASATAMPLVTTSATSPTDKWWPSWWWILGLFFIYWFFACVTTWPLVTKISTAVPLAGKPEPTVPLLNLWTLWWNADRAAHGFNDYWNAPIFYPTKRVFAFSEAQPSMIAVAPLVWLTGHPVLAYNVYLLTGLALNGFLSCLLLRESGHRRVDAFFGGLLVQILPWWHWQLDCVQLVSMGGILWTLLEALRFVRKATVLRAMRLGVAYGVTYWMCNYFGLFFTLLLVPSLPCLAGRWLLRPVDWLKAGLIVLVGSVMVLPIIVVQKANRDDFNWVRSRETIISLSADSGDYTDHWGTRLIDTGDYWDKERHEVGWNLGPGNLRLMAGIAGMVLGILFGPGRRLVVIMLIMGISAYLLSLGPDGKFNGQDLVIWGWRPYDGLLAAVPGFDAIRSPFRFASFVQLFAALGCVQFLSLLVPKRWSWIGWLWKSRLELAAATPVTRSPRNLREIAIFLAKNSPWAAVAGTLFFEVLPFRQTLYDVPSVHPRPVWLMWIQTQTPVDAPLLSLPTSNGTKVGDYADVTESMYWQMWHGRPLLAGYSGFFPQAYLDLRNEIADFPDRDTIATVSKSGARFVVVHRKAATPEELASHPSFQSRWKWRAGDTESQVDVYEVLPEALFFDPTTLPRDEEGRVVSPRRRLPDRAAEPAPLNDVEPTPEP